MIRRRVTLGSVAAVALVLLVGGFAVIRNLDSRLVSDVDARLQTFADDFRNVRGPRPGAREALGPRDRSPFDVRALLVIRLDEDGEVLDALATGPAEDPDAVPDVSALQQGSGPSTVSGNDGSEYRVLAFTDVNGTSTVLGLSLDNVRGTVRQTEQILVVAGVFALAAAAALTWLVIHRGLRPVGAMIGTAERIADGTFSERAAPHNPSDEVGHLGSALNRMLDRLTDAIDAKTESESQMRQFVADASHELRTPLSSIRGYAELYRRGGGDIGRDTAIDIIEHEAARMGSLVDDLLLLARLDQGRPLARDVVELTTLVAEAVDAARVQSISTTVDLELPIGRITLTADAQRLRQVFDNLLTNVRIHGGPDATATVTIVADDAQVTVTVHDDGAGMTAEAQRHALDRFWQAEPADGKESGAGLGLAIANEIVRAHHGTLAISSELGCGTTVAVTLPIPIASAAHEPGSEPPNGLGVTSPASSRPGT